MMPATDLVRNLYQLLVLIQFQALQHGRSDQGMFLHLLELFFRQPSRLI